MAYIQGNYTQEYVEDNGGEGSSISPVLFKKPQGTPFSDNANPAVTLNIFSTRLANNVAKVYPSVGQAYNGTASLEDSLTVRTKYKMCSLEAQRFTFLEIILVSVQI